MRKNEAEPGSSESMNTKLHRRIGNHSRGIRMGALNALETDLETTSSEAGWGHATPARGAGSSFRAGGAGRRKDKSVRTKRLLLTNSQRALAAQSRRRAAGQCVVCGDDAVNKNHCERHRKLCAARERNKYRRMHGIPLRAKLRSVRQPRPRAEGVLV